MNRLLTALLFLVANTGLICAQNGILWEISGNGLKEKSYLLATLKFVGEKEYYLPPTVNDLLLKCSAFAIEDQVDHHAQHELNKAIHFTGSESLKTVMAPSDYQKLVALFEKEFNVPASSFEKKYGHIKPLPLSIMMTRLSLGEKVRYHDIELLRKAKDQGLEAFSLESIEREAEALNSFPIADQVKALNHSVANFATQKSEYIKLMADYPKGNAEEIFEFTLHPTENDPRFLEEFYYKRNDEWMPKIERMISEKATFIAIGLSHLEGERGIITLLQKKGYQLTAIK